MIDKISRNIDNYITEESFENGEKIFMCSDGIGDNFTNEEVGEIFVGKKDIKQVLLQLINEVYSKEEEKNQKGMNNPNPYILGHNEFYEVLKGSSDNMSGVIISNEKEQEQGGRE